MAGLIKLRGFDEAVRRHTWTGSRALVPTTGSRRPCVRCSAGWVVRLDSYIQPALFIDLGLGTAEQITAEICLACRRTNIVALDTINPRTLDAR